MRARGAPPIASRLLALGVLLALASASVATSPALAAPSSTVPPPTPVPIPGGGTSPSPFPTALATPPPSATAPEIGAASAALVDLDSGQVLFEQDGHERRPIASLTKIMTALLVLRRTQPSDVVTVSEDAVEPVRAGIAQLGLRAGETITVEQLLYALLLQSANDAAVALADHVSGSVDAFVAAMNARARRLGLRDTRFASPNGLDDSGYSTALDLARLTRVVERDPLFAQVVSTRFHEIPAPQGPPRVVQNRNALLWLYPGAVGVKTGYTSAAGFCVVAAAEREGLRLVAVVLGEPGEPFSDAAELLDFGFAAFERRPLVQAGERFAAVEVDGRPVQVAAGAGLVGLVPVDADIRRIVRMASGAAFPPARGARIGAVVVFADDLRLGTVPLVVTEVPPPPPPDAGPWWRRAGSALVRAVGRLFAGLFG
ncbi:MAG: D-alanyl-D-alanine carboxypeptidase family protein [Candidatus Velamenicoccus archaeovorus]